MGHINPSLGFVPDSVNDIMERLRKRLESLLGITYQSHEEFADTNIYRLFLGFATELGHLEDEIVRIMDAYISWIRDTNQNIKLSKSGTYRGVMEALLEHFKGAAIACGNNDPSIPPGVALVAIDNTDASDEIPDPRISDEEKQSLNEIFLNYWPAGILTYNPEVKEELDSDNKPDIHEVRVQVDANNPSTYQVALVKLHPLRIQITYKPLAHAIIPKSQDETLREVFLESFELQNAIGRDFDPESYLSTQNIPWLSECVCRWQEVDAPIDTEYSPLRYTIPNYYEKFVIAKDAQTRIPLIDIQLLD